MLNAKFTQRFHNKRFVVKKGFTTSGLSKAVSLASIGFWASRVKNCSRFAGFAVVSSFALAACQTDEVVFKQAEDFAGIVSSDEPRAALIGREVLERGGTAVDAATAMYFAMTVTLPSRVGLASGGSCIVFDGAFEDDDPRRAQSLEFPPVAGEKEGMIPTSARAMAALHARYGFMRWAELVSYGEKMARFGYPVSRAFAYDLALANQRLNVRPQLLARFTREDGTLPREGDRLSQVELSSLLGGIRAKGVGYLYDGPRTRLFAEQSALSGVPLTASDLRTYKPQFHSPLSRELEGLTLYTTGNAELSGNLVAAQSLAIMVESFDFDSLNEGDRVHAIAEASARALSSRTAIKKDASLVESILDDANIAQAAQGYQKAKVSGKRTGQWSPLASDSFAAGFAVIDRYSGGVACSFSLNGLFGAQRMIEGTGVIAASPQRQAAGYATDNISTLLLVKESNDEVRFAGTAAGGAAAPVSLAQVAARTVFGEETLKDAMQKPRIYHSGQPNVAFVEEEGHDAQEALSQAGHKVILAPAFGRVSAAHCAAGSAGDCFAEADGRGYGLAQRAR